MSLPNSELIKTPILQELLAVGGTDDVRFLYERLTGYFPQINETEIDLIKRGKNKYWRTGVQKAGKLLDEDQLLIRCRGIWSLTPAGLEQARAETFGFSLNQEKPKPTTHTDIQKMLVEIGRILGFHAEIEFEYYDVIWRENIKSPRLSHVFEVQSKGNIDSAFAKLKRAFDAQRTKPFLIISTERDLNRANKSLIREFRELENFVRIFTFSQISLVHRNISEIGGVLSEFLEK